MNTILRGGCHNKKGLTWYYGFSEQDIKKALTEKTCKCLFLFGSGGQI
jgi:hypothetical protein